MASPFSCVRRAAGVSGGTSWGLRNTNGALVDRPHHNAVQAGPVLQWVGRSTRDWGCPAGGTYQGAFAHPPTALLQVPPQSGSPTWGKGAVAASSTLQRVLPREVTHVRPKSHIPLLQADDTWGRVPPHIFINLWILVPRGRELGQRPCPAGTPTWVGFQ